MRRLFLTEDEFTGAFFTESHRADGPRTASCSGVTDRSLTCRLARFDVGLPHPARPSPSGHIDIRLPVLFFMDFAGPNRRRFREVRTYGTPAGQSRRCVKPDATAP